MQKPNSDLLIQPVIWLHVYGYNHLFFLTTSASISPTSRITCFDIFLALHHKKPFSVLDS